MSVPDAVSPKARYKYNEENGNVVLSRIILHIIPHQCLLSTTLCKKNSVVHCPTLGIGLHQGSRQAGSKACESKCNAQALLMFIPDMFTPLAPHRGRNSALGTISMHGRQDTLSAGYGLPATGNSQRYATKDTDAKHPTPSAHIGISCDPVGLI